MCPQEVGADPTGWHAPCRWAGGSRPGNRAILVNLVVQGHEWVAGNIQAKLMLLVSEVPDPRTLHPSCRSTETWTIFCLVRAGLLRMHKPCRIQPNAFFRRQRCFRTLHKHAVELSEGLSHQARSIHQRTRTFEPLSKLHVVCGLSSVAVLHSHSISSTSAEPPVLLLSLALWSRKHDTSVFLCYQATPFRSCTTAACPAEQYSIPAATTAAVALRHRLAAAIRLE